MHFVIGDVHNESRKLKLLLSNLSPRREDTVIFLGDLFDRGGDSANPTGVYETVLDLSCKKIFILGNHDLWLCKYIDDSLEASLTQKAQLRPYPYNTYKILRKDLPDSRLNEVSSFIHSFVLQTECSILDSRFLFAHAMTSKAIKDDHFHTLGFKENYAEYFANGVSGYTSVVGHNYRMNMTRYGGTYDDIHAPSIWRNDIENVIMIDSGAGFEHGKLCGVCLESMDVFYY